MKQILMLERKMMQSAEGCQDSAAFCLAQLHLLAYLTYPPCLPMHDRERSPQYIAHPHTMVS